ncbi:hypothetical protein H0H81_008895 [Sphagnurus paluster]|uniref:Uncharacterized protein n=1 Tax=Sphagnurus paluster TaxID=117069 RepID=A0A9P7FQ02_9AGAR|nr:hypothetical protein H0H81_008895 [Sphagnurus paluster]
MSETDTLSENSLDDLGPIYIFPNPATSAPPSPTSLTDLSEATEFTPSIRSLTLQLPSGRDRRPTSSMFSPFTPLSPVDWESFELDLKTWMRQSPARRIPLETVPGHSKSKAEQVLIDRRTPDVMPTYPIDLSPVISDDHMHRDLENPHRRTPNIPLLSFFISLLSIDDSTARLLSHSSDPLLFESGSLSEKVDTEPHGIERLFIQRKEVHKIREALANFEVEVGPSQLSLPTFPIYGLWNAVAVLVTSGGKALRGALR